MQRIYEEVVADHFPAHRQMLFLSGPRQVGKTTAAMRAARSFAEHVYVSWDRRDDRRVLLAGADALAAHLHLERRRDAPPLCLLDEIHRYRKWKTLLKGFFDAYPGGAHVLVTGSARLDVYRAGGDSLMGRYFPYRLHPLSAAELVRPALPQVAPHPEPDPLDAERFDALWRFGGFPEPFLRAEERFARRWRRLRAQQLFREDLRDLTRIQDLAQVEVLAELVRARVAGLCSYASLARDADTTIVTVKRWLRTLRSLYYCFEVRPWSRNVARALRKEPKSYLWDWSLVDDPGARAENLVGCALLKAAHFWTDHGLGDFSLHFVRDKDKREVDFLLVRDGRPWLLVEVKLSGSASLSPHLGHFQRQTGAAHALQVAIDLPPTHVDCFAASAPAIVPARTFLTQLV